MIVLHEHMAVHTLSVYTPAVYSLLPVRNLTRTQNQPGFQRTISVRRSPDGPNLTEYLLKVPGCEVTQSFSSVFSIYLK